MAPKTQQEKAREFLQAFHKARAWNAKEKILDKHRVHHAQRSIEELKAAHDKYLQGKNIVHYIKNRP